MNDTPEDRIAKVRELDATLQLHGRYTSSGTLFTIASLAPALADDCERLLAEKTLAQACGKIAVDSCEVLEKANIKLRAKLTAARKALERIETPSNYNHGGPFFFATGVMEAATAALATISEP